MKPGSKLRGRCLITNQPLNDAHRSYAARIANMACMRPTYAIDLALGGAMPIAVARFY
jgi:hypothetical protein